MSAADPDHMLTAKLAEDLDRHFEELVRCHQDRLFAFVLGMGRDRGLAEEVVQDAFVKAYRALRSYPAARVATLHLRAWLHRITLNTFRNAVRGRRSPLTLEDGAREPADPALGPEEVALRRIEQDGLVAALSRIPARFRAAILLYHGQDLSYADTAAALGVPVGTVKSHIHRGLPLLRQALHEIGDGEVASA